MLMTRGLLAGGVCVLMINMPTIALPPAPPKPGLPSVLNFKAQENGAAQAGWVPMEGSPAASVVKLGDVGVLRMPCSFVAGRIERASWDLPVTLDLSACRGVRLQILCTDLSPISYFTLYSRAAAVGTAPNSLREEWRLVYCRSR